MPSTTHPLTPSPSHSKAYVEFSGPDDRERAMTKDRQHMVTSILYTSIGTITVE